MIKEDEDLWPLSDSDEDPSFLGKETLGTQTLPPGGRGNKILSKSHSWIDPEDDMPSHCGKGLMNPGPESNATTGLTDHLHSPMILTRTLFLRLPSNSP
jgi:hypothetical protein